MKKITFKIIKKNQLLTITVGMMLVVAGYLNYTYDEKRKYDVELTGNIEEFGDAILVDSKNVETNVEEIIETVKSRKVTEEYFVQTKIDRTNSYAEQIETYEKMLNNNNLKDEQKKFAQEEIKRINEERNAIIISENLIKLKGFEEVVIMVNDESINVIIKEDKIEDKQIAQIQNIIVHEFGVDVEKVHITTPNV